MMRFGRRWGPLRMRVLAKNRTSRDAITEAPLGIGGETALFSVVNGVLLKYPCPLPKSLQRSLPP